MLYQVRDLCGIKSGHCVVSKSYLCPHVLRWDSYTMILCCINIGVFCFIKIGIVLYQDCGLVMYQVNDSHIRYPMRKDLQLRRWTCVVSSHVVILCDVLLVVAIECYKYPWA